jgi:hypothetical protein
MTKPELEEIKEQCSDARRYALDILGGGENYDGADGAREVRDLTASMEKLIAAVEPHATE